MSNRKREEIDRVITMILGIVDKEYQGYRKMPDVSVEFSTDTFEWWVMHLPFGDGTRRITVGGSKILGQDRSLVYPNVRPGNVRLVHEALDTFVQGMMRTFPDQKEEIEQLLCVSGIPASH